MCVQVAQHGIRAILPGSTQQDLEEPLGDISGGDATWKAWKLVELHTAQVCGITFLVFYYFFVLVDHAWPPCQCQP